MLESKFRKELIEEIEALLPGCVVIYNDPRYMQGLPDLQILFNRRWGMLETKGAMKAKRQPNQEYYVEFFDSMSFARFVCPENKEEVLYELERSLKAC